MYARCLYASEKRDTAELKDETTCLHSWQEVEFPSGLEVDVIVFRQHQQLRGLDRAGLGMSLGAIGKVGHSGSIFAPVIPKRVLIINSDGSSVQLCELAKY